METLSFIRILVLLVAAGLFFIFSRRISRSLLQGYVLVGVGLSLVLMNLFIGALFHGTLLSEQWRDRSFPIVGFISGYVGQTIGLVLLLVGTYRLIQSLQPLLAEHYSSLVEHSLVGVYLIQDGVFKFVNPRLAEIFGYERKELVGKSFVDLVAPQSHDLVTENIRKRVTGAMQSINYQFIGRRKNGESFDTEVYGSRTIYKGKPAVHGTLLDITERKRAEEALRESEEKYRTILENIEDGYYEVDIAGNFTFFNDTLCDILGYPQEELMGMNNRRYTDPENAKKLYQAFNQVYRTGEPAKGLDWEIIRKDGTKRFVEASVSLIREAGSQRTGFRGIVRDITARKRAEQALHASERRLRESLAFQQRLIASLPTISFITTDLNAIVTSFSPGAEQIFGYRAEEIVGQTVAKLHLPEDVATFPEIIRAQIEGHIGYSGEITLVRKNGERFPAHFITSPILDEERKVVALLGVSQDITKRKQAEEQLRKLSCAIEQSPSSMVITDTAGNIEYVNPKFTQMTGYTLEEVVGRNPSILKSGKTPAEEYKRLWDTITSGGEWRGEFQNKKKNGEHCWVLSSISPITNAKGVITHFLAVEEDITERKQAEEERRQFEAQIQHAQKLESLGVLAGGIAHDFNNLLVGILGNAGLALAELSPESPARDTIQQIETAGQRAAELVKQMLAYSGKGHFLVKRLNLNAIVEEMTHLLQVSISKHVVLRYNFVRNLPAVEADATQIRQVVMNLVVNASEAIGEKTGVITISTGAVRADCAYLTETYLAHELSAGDYVYLEVADTGCGMDAETQAKIFDPFFTTKFTGRGLGLAAVLGIVRGHKGALKVYSEPGRGTTFKILLPCVEASAKSLSAENQTTAAWHLPAPAGGSSTVLVVDDEETVRTVTSRMLKHFGFTVLLAADGRTGIEAFRAHADEIACVLLDMTMPYPNGEEVFREIRRLKRDARVILMSDFNEPEATDHFAGKGLAGFLQKPYTPHDLREKLQSVLEKK